MKQIISGQTFGVPTTDTRWIIPNNIGDGFNITETDGEGLVGSAGTFRNLFLELDSAPGEGTSLTFTLRINGADSNLTKTISNTDTTGNLTGTDVTVSAGDTISLQCVPTNTPTTAAFIWNLEYEGDTANESLIFGNTGGSNLTTTANSYMNLNAEGVDDSAEIDRGQLVSTGGTIKKLYVELETAPGAGKSWDLTIRKGTVASRSDTVVIVTVAETATTGNGSALNFTVAAGDIINFQADPTGTPTASPLSYGCVFVADTNGESLLLGGTDNSMHTTTTEYQSWGNDESWITPESIPTIITGGIVVRNFYFAVETAPGGGKSWDLTIRKEGSDTTLTIEIANTATSNNITGTDITFAQGENFVIKAVPTGGPTVGRSYWGATQFISPSASTITSTYEGGFLRGSSGLTTKLDSLNTGAATTDADKKIIILLPAGKQFVVEVYTLLRGS